MGQLVDFFSNLFKSNSPGNTYNNYVNALQQREAALDRSFQTQSAQEAMKWSSKEAQLNRDWQERLSNTEMQRRVADLESAGLNPVLAASIGGASTPAGSVGQAFSASGAQAQLSSDNVNNDTLQSILGVIGSAISLAMIKGIK